MKENTVMYASITLGKCRICSASLFLAEITLDNNGCETRIYQCEGCGVLVNESILMSESDNEVAQSEFLEDIYSAENWKTKELETNYNTYVSMLSALLLRLPSHNYGKFVDVGSGSGFAAAAAMSKYENVIATDLRIDIVARNLELLSIKNVMLEKTLIPETKNVDCFFLWHVLEHLKNPLEVINQMAEKLNPNGVIIFQVPLFRKENTFKQHFHFYNANTIRFISKLCNLEIFSIDFDKNLAFMTGILIKRNN